MPSDQLFSLPLEEQVGQFFFIGLTGTEIDAEARELIEEVKPGGIILFGRNVESPEQVRKLLDDARDLLLAGDVLPEEDHSGGFTVLDQRDQAGRRGQARVTVDHPLAGQLLR